MEIDANLLVVDRMCKSFMGVKAVDSLSIQVKGSEIMGLIGPNGAGKTTVFNLITKLYELDEGQMTLCGQDITTLSTHQINRVGIARTFQNIRLLNQLSVLENILVSLGTRLQYSMKDVVLHSRSYRMAEKEQREVAYGYLQQAGLHERVDDKAKSLPYGQQRQLEIARALATKPKLLLMDEPTAGMNGTEKNSLKEYIRKIVQEGISVILIEHDMSFVMDICSRITVLNYGKKIAEGTPAEIQANESVIEAYLGSNELC